MEEQKLQMFENKVLRKRSGPEKGEISKQFIIFHNKELYNLHSKSKSMSKITAK
jgi:hypothetical protein